MAATASAERLSINLRADATSRDLIDRAAEVLGKNRSEFMLDAAPSDIARLQRLLRTRAPWER